MTTLESVRDLARRAHAGQVDKMGRDYYTAHLEPIAERLAPLGPDAEMAGLLHDILEDTDVTVAELTDFGVPAHVIRAVVAVTKNDGEDYSAAIERAAADPLGRQVKLADNAQNLSGNAALAERDPQTAARLKQKYETARERLLAAVCDDPAR
ncbi:phosphohydrolase [Gordonia sp. VNQ95]|jgi:(p)ppGpp synthase/HD superfamily hydrolase|uniref:phosphohydrolase n=1 Tax=Gordonia sp. VNQ95 TaxID=3156619 RepID=UPI0032B4E0D0